MRTNYRDFIFCFRIALYLCCLFSLVILLFWCCMIFSVRFFMLCVSSEFLSCDYYQVCVKCLTHNRCVSSDDLSASIICNIQSFFSSPFLFCCHKLSLFICALITKLPCLQLSLIPPFPPQTFVITVSYTILKDIYSFLLLSPVRRFTQSFVYACLCFQRNSSF